MCDCLQILYNMWEACEYICVLNSVSFAKKNHMYCNNNICFCVHVLNIGDSEDAAADCGCQHVQELLHHRGHVPPPPLLRIRWRCSLWNC